MASLLRPRQDTKPRHRPRLHHLLRLPLLQPLRHPEPPQSRDVRVVRADYVSDMAVHHFRDDAYESEAI